MPASVTLVGMGLAVTQQKESISMTQHTPGPWDYYELGEDSTPCAHKDCELNDPNKIGYFTVPGGHGDHECPV